MKKILNVILCAVFVCAGVGMAQARTIHTEITTSQIIKETDKTFEISELDLNKDGKYTMEEVGEKLFNLYDTDGNHVIDNIEYERPSVVTVVPMKKETKTIVDENDDGVPDEETIADQEFMEETGLAVFDKNNDGLSPKDFMKTFFRDADKNKDHVVSLREWQSVYLKSVNPVRESQRYN